MEMILLNSELAMPVPAGFHIMDEAEKGKLRFLVDGPCECLSDPERHILVSAGWKNTGAFSSFLLKQSEIAADAEKKVHKAMKSMDYSCAGFKKRKIADAEAEGFAYSYRAQETEMASETFVLKLGKTIYYFHFYIRAELKDDGLPVWNEILDGIRIK